MEAKQYIVQVSGDRNFFTALREGKVCGTEFPSYAAHLGYATADEICQRLLKLGYWDAVVCDILGQPVTAAHLQASRPVFSHLEIAGVWDDRLNEADQSVYRSYLAGEQPADLARRLNIPADEVLATIKRGDNWREASVAILREANQEARIFAEVKAADHQVRQNKQ